MEVFCIKAQHSDGWLEQVTFGPAQARILSLQPGKTGFFNLGKTSPHAISCRHVEAASFQS
jgi:hypothetical protein